MCAALPVITVTRDAKAPMPSLDSVGLPVADLEAPWAVTAASAQICAITVSIPAPRTQPGHHLDIRPAEGRCGPRRTAKSALFNEEAKAEPHVLPRARRARSRPGAVGNRKGEKLVEQPGIVAEVVGDMRAQRVQAAIEGHCSRRDKVDLPDSDGVAPDPPRNFVHQPLAHEGAFITARRAIGAAWRLVGQPMWPAPDRPARDKGPGSIPAVRSGTVRHGCAYRRPGLDRTRHRSRG